MRILAGIISFFLLVTTAVAQDASEAKPLTEAQIRDQRRGEALQNKINSRHPRFSLIGPVERDASGVLSINGEVITLNPETRIEGELIVGMPVSAHGFIEGGQKVARVIQPGPATSAAADGAPPASAAILDQ